MTCRISLPIGRNGARLSFAAETAADALSQMLAADLGAIRRAVNDAGSEPAPECDHGTRVFRTGIKGAHQWSAWLCAAGPDAADKCEPLWQ